MKVVLIFFISMLLMAWPGETLMKRKLKPFDKQNLENWNIKESAVYIATQTGNKTLVPRQLIKIYKEFGLLHLMTPSGIHLSSILIFIFLFIKKRLRLWVYIPLLIISFYASGFYSLKRIIYFHIFKFLTKSNKLSFILTFLFDLIIGGYTLSPLSFTFSFLCWGVIVFSRNKLEICTNLFASQMLICIFFDQPLNFLSFILNPLLTGLFSSFFPIMSMNFWFFNCTWLYDIIHFFIKSFNITLVFSAKSFQFLSITPTLSIFILFAYLNIQMPKKAFIMILILFHFSPMKTLDNKLTSGSFMATHEKRENLLKISGDKYYYFNRVCKRELRQALWDINCKKKALQFGGPELY